MEAGAVLLCVQIRTLVTPVKIFPDVFHLNIEYKRITSFVPRIFQFCNSSLRKFLTVEAIHQRLVLNNILQ